MTSIAEQQSPRGAAGLDPYGAATHEVFNQPTELVDYNLYEFRRRAQGGGATGGRGVGRKRAPGVRRACGIGRHLGAWGPRQQEPARARHPRPLRAAGRSRPLSPCVPCADADRDRGGHPFLALDRPARRRACRARGALLHAKRGRGRPRLPDHHDLRLRPLPES